MQVWLNLKIIQFYLIELSYIYSNKRAFYCKQYFKSNNKCKHNIIKHLQFNLALINYQT